MLAVAEMASGPETTISADIFSAREVLMIGSATKLESPTGSENSGSQLRRVHSDAITDLECAKLGVKKWPLEGMTGSDWRR
jgi:hypothetical protein